MSEAETDLVFHALAVSTRRDILRRTMAQEQSVTVLARDYDMSFASVQKHVSVLEQAELIIKRAQGRERLVRANPDRLEQARILLVQYESLWRGRVDRLEDLLETQALPQPPNLPQPPESPTTAQTPTIPS
ncbi:MAG: ArsR/SmtB family transcription factor [Galactobacter sp.]